MVDGRAGRYRYLFTHCVIAEYETLVQKETWPISWDDLFIDYDIWEKSGAPGGFVWGVCWASAYPGLEYFKNSERAGLWATQLGHEMHEVSIETNAYMLRLIFHEVRVVKVGDDTDLIRSVNIPLG